MPDESDGSISSLMEVGENTQPGDSLRSLGLGRGSVLEFVLAAAAAAAAAQRAASRVAAYGVPGCSRPLPEARSRCLPLVGGVIVMLRFLCDIFV